MIVVVIIIITTIIIINHRQGYDDDDDYCQSLSRLRIICMELNDCQFKRSISRLRCKDHIYFMEEPVLTVTRGLIIMVSYGIWICKKSWGHRQLCSEAIYRL